MLILIINNNTKKQIHAHASGTIDHPFIRFNCQQNTHMHKATFVYKRLDTSVFSSIRFQTKHQIKSHHRMHVTHKRSKWRKKQKQNQTCIKRKVKAKSKQTLHNTKKGPINITHIKNSQTNKT